ncbi:hypothetical protein [Fervidobacterium thailandense]|uniref:hypothetical protein n=1 Tax=Fervidobacterium thailandense TaxID=1008305 RepID=UPI0013012BA1|nr:hypothetical protein [Fervidobacterium thailandense]
MAEVLQALIVTAATGKRAYPEKRFLVIRKDENPLVPCGIPYIFHELGAVEKNYKIWRL